MWHPGAFLIYSSIYQYNKKYVETYLKKKDEIRIRVPKGEKERIKNAAAAAGKSLNSFVYDLILQAIGSGE